jgi:hypothetical protein
MNAEAAARRKTFVILFKIGYLHNIVETEIVFNLLLPYYRVTLV